MRYVHGQWQDHDGNPLELVEPEIELHEDVSETDDVREEKPKRTRSAAKKDPREAKGAQ